MVPGKFGIQETFIVPQIKIHFPAVPEDIDFAVLERTHSPRIDVDIGINLDGGYAVSPVLEVPSH
jgi:hypothetical protein